MRTFVLVTASLLLAACGTPVGTCTAATSTDLTAADGGTVTCLCQGPCGCFFGDGGRCP